MRWTGRGNLGAGVGVPIEPAGTVLRKKARVLRAFLFAGAVVEAPALLWSRQFCIEFMSFAASFDY